MNRWRRASRHARWKGTGRHQGRWGRRLLRAAILLPAAALALSILRVGQVPKVDVDPALPGIGPRTPVGVAVRAAGRGLAGIRVELLQGEEMRVLLAERGHRPRPYWSWWGPRVVEERFELKVGSETIDDLQEGEATLRVTAERAGTWLRQPSPAVVDRILTVHLRPPSIAVLSSLHYAAQGGSELVVYRVGERAAVDGVRAGSSWFPGYPLPGGSAGDRLSLFAIPFDLGDESQVRLVARDELGNEASRPFLDLFTPRPPRQGTIRLDDDFMARVVPEILARSSGELADRGDLLQNYLAINGDLRRKNNERLRRIAAETRPALLWRSAFLQLPESQVMSPFAVERRYLYGGEEVDRQNHLGFDLASRRRAPVPAANSGTVLLAEFFGIFGNAVVIDHGFGLMSLYAHLSSIDVEVGQELRRGEILGRTGATGLAGGDHLHFSILVQGEPVTAMEWWDGKWIRDRIMRKLGFQ